jgi:alpha-glucosidase
LITDKDIYAYLRQTEDSEGLVVANFSSESKKFTLPAGKWRRALANQATRVSNGVITLNPWGCCALESKK